VFRALWLESISLGLLESALDALDALVVISFSGAVLRLLDTVAECSAIMKAGRRAGEEARAVRFV